MDNTQDFFNTYVNKSGIVIRSYVDIALNCLETTTLIPEDQKWVYKHLLLSCHLSSESVLTLILNNRLWDAESIIRTIIEGTIKLIYLSTGSVDIREKRLYEFWYILPKINLMKRHTRAVNALDAFDKNHSVEWEHVRENVLSESVLKEINERWPRKVRQEIEKRWSFSEMVKELSSEEIFKNIATLAYNYGYGSHMIHQDADALGLIRDWVHMSDDRREAFEYAHATREINDLLTLEMIRNLVIRNLTNDDIEAVFLESHVKLNHELEKFHDNYWTLEMNYRKNNF
ncbi:DUF5677 domain-containing protein [Paenibacillus ferrarius]|uniref:DUF5677 domain-containing protein n=1 Tax=Paenibacillus ferrarius TaxID=1469647 RepID=UPI003D2A1646